MFVRMYIYLERNEFFLETFQKLTVMVLLCKEANILEDNVYSSL